MTAKLGTGPDDIAKAFGVPQWDVLIISDGSARKGCGWGALLFDKNGLRKKMRGAMNWGSIHIAELMPCWHALAWYAYGPGKAELHRRRSSGKEAKLAVLLILDSKTIVAQGNGDGKKSSNLSVWAALESLQAFGLELHWRWAARAEIADNRSADQLAREARQALEKLDTKKGKKNAGKRRRDH